MPESPPEVSSKQPPVRVAQGGWGVAVGMAAMYMLGMAVVWQFAHTSYSQAAVLMHDVWWAMVILATLAVVVARLTGLRIQRSNRITGFAFVAIVPVVLAVMGSIGAISVSRVNHWNLIGIVVLGTLFVGIGEETTYRGVVLNALADRLSVPWMVIISSVFFGLLHTVNLLLQSAQATAVQVVITTCIGLLFGWTYVSTGGNLWLVIVLHWLYDASLISSLATSHGTNLMGAVPSLLLAVGGIGATVVFGRRYRGQRWNDIA